jgi:hypothetical protein
MDMAFTLIYKAGKVVKEKYEQVSRLSPLAKEMLEDVQWVINDIGPNQHRLRADQVDDIAQALKCILDYLIENADLTTDMAKFSVWVKSSSTEHKLRSFQSDLAKYKKRVESAKISALLEGQAKQDKRDEMLDKQFSALVGLVGAEAAARAKQIQEDKEQAELKDLKGELAKLQADCEFMQELIDEKGSIRGTKKSVLDKAKVIAKSAKSLLGSMAATSLSSMPKREQIVKIIREIEHMTKELRRLQAEYQQICLDLCVECTFMTKTTLQNTWDLEIVPVMNKLVKKATKAFASVPSALSSIRIPELPELPPSLTDCCRPSQNSEGRPVHLGGGPEGLSSGGDTNLHASKVYYCGAKMNQCRCGGCDGTCGPYNGCPCKSCKALLGNIPDVAFGELELPDGNYRGMLKKGMPYGQGVLSFESGVVFEGDFSERGLIKGKKTSDNHDQIYTGEFQDMEPHGQGRVDWSDGSYYVGSFKEGEFDGEGEWYDAADGESYTGGFKCGMKHGRGEHYYRGQHRQGVWDDGVFQR